MKFLTDYRNRDLAKTIVKKIYKIAPDSHTRIMQFCGGHTTTLLKYGIFDLLPDTVEMVSGPGCPVCVTSEDEIDSAIEMACRPEVIFTSFGDMLRVKGSTKSLDKLRLDGADIRVVYSPDDALTIAKQNPDRKVIFFAIGFETTAPLTASSVLLAEKLKVNNFYIFPVHKTTPGILKVLMDGNVNLDGFICPGHVTTITGASVYRILEEAGKPAVVTGFEPIDMLSSIYFVLKQLKNNNGAIENQYSRVVKPEGNQTAQKIIQKVFDLADTVWRGIGNIPKNGLKLKERYASFDAQRQFQTGLKKEITPDKLLKNCICGLILKGLKTPHDCKLFDKKCSPEEPVGACMVSEEGTCSIYYRFFRKKAPISNPNPRL